MPVRVRFNGGYQQVINISCEFFCCSASLARWIGQARILLSVARRKSLVSKCCVGAGFFLICRRYDDLALERLPVKT